MVSFTNLLQLSFNGLVSRKAEPFWILLWQWHQLDHMQIICSSLQTDNHDSTSSPNFFAGRKLFLMPNQQCQSIEGSSDIRQDAVFQSCNFVKFQEPHRYSKTSQGLKLDEKAGSPRCLPRNRSAMISE